MKSKDWDKIMEITFGGNAHPHCNVGIDGTDHMTFFCGKCDKPLRVIEVDNEKRDYGSGLDVCTRIRGYCEKCKTLGYRKFYWNDERCVKYCTKKTK